MTDARPRVFARWRRGPDPGPGYAEIPSDGACLSAFLIVRDPADAGRVVLGTPNPDGDWARIGALDPERLAKFGGRLMLPSSHLLEYESPDAAARRVAEEQLERRDLDLSGPQVVSDAYGRPSADGKHWDFHFLYRATWPKGVPLAARPWSRLAFEDPRGLPKARYARAHDDILRFAGFETPD